MVRGNQEGCDRAPQGWRMFLDPYPYKDDCTLYDPPYIISLEAVDLLVHDSSALYPDKEAFLPLEQLSHIHTSKGKETWLLTHQPPWGVVMDKNDKVILNEHNYIQHFLEPFPETLTTIFSGHVHAFQGIKLASTPIHQFVIGNGGVGLEEERPPEIMDYVRIDHQDIEHVLSVVKFGYAMINISEEKWKLEAKDLQNQNIATFDFDRFGHNHQD